MTSSIYDIMMGDYTQGRGIAIKISIGIIISTGVILGGRKVMMIVKKQMGW